MPQITRKLIRKRAEHNEGVVSTLEELSLHQEELEEINEVLGMTCRKLKILYLQNNIIPKMENLTHMKDLEYLNLALNNIAKIEGLSNCEFLRKLDLTVNFVDYDTLKESIDHLVSRESLRELYMMGNPAAEWKDFNSYVIAKLPQLNALDGTEITKSMRIKAVQSLERLEKELELLALKFREKKALKELENKNAVNTKKKDSAITSSRVKELPDGVNVEDVDSENENNEDDSNELTENTPEVRVKIYQELAQQKKEKEDRANINTPKERDYEKEQQDAIAQTRVKEQEISASEIKQKNEGGWDFFWDEESQPGYVRLEVQVARFMDSSLIDVDVHPSYISIVIKSKILRLRLPAEVRASDSRCQRSKTTGSLIVIMPKVNPRENDVTVRGDIRAREEGPRLANIPTLTANKNKSKSKNDAGRVRYKDGSDAPATKKPLSLQEQILEEARQAVAAATLNNNKQDDRSREFLSGDTQQSTFKDTLQSIVPEKIKKSIGIVDSGDSSSKSIMEQNSKPTFTSESILELD